MNAAADQQPEDAAPRRHEHTAAACAHGGQAWAAPGLNLLSAGPSAVVIDADVLDAWFDPSPAVLSVLRARLPWLVRSSPPVDGGLLADALARFDALPPECVLPGAGSSDLIFRALPSWVAPGDRVLLVAPCYGEYAHLLAGRLACQLETLPLLREQGYALDATRLAAALSENPPALVVLVNPNSPTGTHSMAQALLPALEAAPASTRFWIDETYAPFVGPQLSLAHWAARRPGAVVCTSLSKAWALSGLRVARLVGHPDTLHPVRQLTPPWNVGLLAAVAAAAALDDQTYYRARWAETGVLRQQLSVGLQSLGLDVVPGSAGFVLAHLPTGLCSARVTDHARRQGLYVRDTTNLGLPGALRVAVKAPPLQRALLARLAGAIDAARQELGNEPAA